MKEQILRGLSLAVLTLGLGTIWEAVTPTNVAHAQTGGITCPVGSASPPATCTGNCTNPLKCGKSVRTGLCQCA